MELRQLRYFAAVVEEGTVTGAAARLAMTQPPLTAQLHALEQELGCRLFEHEGRRLRLTEAGRILYARARAIQGLCDAAAAEMADYGAGTVGTLRLGVVSSVRGELLGEWLARFSARWPGVRFDLNGENTYRQLELVRTGQVDLAVVRTPFAPEGLEQLPLRRESMVAAGLPAFFAGAPAGPLPLSALEGRPLILYRRWEEVLRGRFEAAGCRAQVICRNDDAPTTLALARSGLGVGILPASGLPEAAPAELTVRPLADEALHTEIAAVCAGYRRLPRPARLFWEMLAEESREKSQEPHKSFT
jgi:DNA-binding transcriptional LysR family regulator